LFLSSSHHTIIKLFSMGHDPGEPYVTHFTQGSLALFVVVYLILMSVGAGVAIPGGLFMPSLIVSQAWDGVLLVQGGTSSDILGAVGVLYPKQRQQAGMIFAPGRAVCLHALRGCAAMVLQVGAAWGGLWGSTLRSWIPTWNIQPGVYGVMAGASVLAGVFRQVSCVVGCRTNA
jgi:hypothetical protein